MKPIVLNQYGETLVFDTSFAVSEDMSFDRVSLMHGSCHEPARICSVSDTHNGIFCSVHGRIPEPATSLRELTL